MKRQLYWLQGQELKAVQIDGFWFITYCSNDITWRILDDARGNMKKFKNLDTLVKFLHSYDVTEIKVVCENNL